MKLVTGNKHQMGSKVGLHALSIGTFEAKNLAHQRPEDVKRLRALHDTRAARVRPTPLGRGLKNDLGGDDADEAGDREAKRRLRKEKGAANTNKSTGEP